MLQPLLIIEVPITMSLDSAITTLVSRLEQVTARLEQVEKQIASGAVSAASSGGAAAVSAPAGADPSQLPVVREYDNLINQYIRTYMDLSKKIDPVVAQQAEAVLRAVEAQKTMIGIAATSKKPADSVLQQLIKATSDAMSEVTTIRDKNRTNKFFNNLSAISEGIPALGWVLVSPTPGPHVADMRAGSEFYSNRVLKDFKGKDQTQVDWVAAFNGFLKDLQVYVKNYHTTGLTWNPSGGDASAGATSAPKPPAAPAAPPAPPAGAPPAAGGASKQGDMNAVFASLNKGEAVTSGLKKVTADMKTKNQPGRSAVVPASASEKKAKESKSESSKAAAAKPPRFTLEGNKWIVEYQTNNKDIVISETETKQTVYIFGCSNSTIQIKGKVNAITIDGCKRTGVVFESAVSGVEVVNCTSLEVQILGKVPNVAIDKTSGVQLYLSKDCLDAEIVTSKSSEMNVLLPSEGDQDIVELPVPEQFKTFVRSGKLVTECVQHAG
jgi:adenylyl cyclase-associated protein